MCTQTTHKYHPISSLKEKHIAEENISSLKKWRNFFNAKKEEFSIKKDILQNLLDKFENEKIFLSKNLLEKYDILIDDFDTNKKYLSDKLSDAYFKEKNLMQITKSKIDVQAIKLRSYIAEMECFSHDLNYLPNEEILEIDLVKLSSLNNETSNIIYESVKNKNTNFCFKDFNSIEECFLNKKEINLIDYLNENSKILSENKRKLLQEKLDKDKNNFIPLNLDNNIRNNSEDKFKYRNSEENIKKSESFNFFNEFDNFNIKENIEITNNHNDDNYKNSSTLITGDLKKENSNIKINNNNPNNTNEENNNNILKNNNLIDLNNSYFNLSVEQNDINNLNLNNSSNFNLNNNPSSSFPISPNYIRKSSFNNNEIRNETTINFIPYSGDGRKKSENNSSTNKYTKSLERQYISNLNNKNANMNYKIKKNEENEKINYENFINQKGFYEFDNIKDLILFIGDSKDKSILLFNKKNFSWKKLENSILGEYEFLDYCCLSKFSENTYLISGGCVYSNYKNTASNSTYLVKIVNHNENFLISFLPFKSMNKARFSHGSCQLRKKTYLFGGHDGTHTLNCIEYYDVDAQIFSFVYEDITSVSTNSNTNNNNNLDSNNKILSEMNIEREIFASCVVDDRYIYIFGGFNDVHLDSIERFDVESGIWKLLSVKLSSSLQNATACTIENNEIVIIGGYNGSLQRSIEIFNYEKNIFVSNPNDIKMIIPRRRAHCFELGKKV
jgi:hypothetical protein